MTNSSKCRHRLQQKNSNTYLCPLHVHVDVTQETTHISLTCKSVKCEISLYLTIVSLSPCWSCCVLILCLIRLISLSKLFAVLLTSIRSGQISEAFAIEACRTNALDQSHIHLLVSVNARMLAGQCAVTCNSCSFAFSSLFRPPILSR